MSKKKSSKGPKYASSRDKIKAFLTDSFMLVMPIMYVVFYLLMGSREEFAENRAVGWIYILVPLIIVQTIFLWKSGQTPGYRAYNLMLVGNNDNTTPTLLTVFTRSVLATISIVMWPFMFFHKNSKSIHDILTNTSVVMK